MIAWPDGHLEHLGSCPLCRSAARDVLYSDLTDTVMGCAPGKWTLWKCSGCGCAYLDPRPDRATIALAYAQYHTHAPGSHTQNVVERWRLLYHKLRQAALRDYVNGKFGHTLGPALVGARLIIGFSPRFSRMAYGQIRHLPVPQTRTELLLDVGCGNGSFLSVAERIGYDPIGLEPDPKAASVAQNEGGRVIVGHLPSDELSGNSFAHVTMSHVLEHLHDPISILNESYRLLKPGGRIWLATPNIESALSNYFHRHWRGLEPPRHLVLFLPDLVRSVLQNVGFRSVEILAPSLEARWMACASLSLKNHGTNVGMRDLPSEVRAKIRHADNNAKIDYRYGESITAIGYKPA